MNQNNTSLCSDPADNKYNNSKGLTLAEIKKICPESYVPCTTEERAAMKIFGCPTAESSYLKCCSKQSSDSSSLIGGCVNPYALGYDLNSRCPSEKMLENADHEFYEYRAKYQSGDSHHESHNGDNGNGGDNGDGDGETKKKKGT